MVSGARLNRLVRKELRQMFRDLRLRGMIVVAPVIQLLVFGYAVSTDVRHVPTWVVDQDRTPASRELVARLTASGYFDVAGASERGEDGVRALQSGRARVALEIPPGYERDLGTSTARLQALVDGTDANTGNIVLSYLLRIVQRMAVESTGLTGGITLASRAWYNPALESRVYNVPAVMGILLFLIPMLLTSLSVVREREIGTWEQLTVSPITPTELMLGKTLPVALIGLGQLVLVSAVAVLWFDIPIRGQPLALLFAAIPYLGAGIAIGLVISTVSNTQQEAFMSMFLVLLPGLIFSGFMFPVASMPEPFQWLTQVNPVRHFLVVVRGVFLRGTSFGDHLVQYAALWAMALAGLTIAVRRFRAMVG
jgi:ABC-2 type transport system permease protein